MIFVGFMDGPKAVRYYDAQHQEEPVAAPKRAGTTHIPPPARETHARNVKKPTDYAVLGNPDIRRLSSRYNAEVEAEKARDRRSEKIVEEMVEDQNEEEFAAFAWMAGEIGPDVPKTLKQARESPEWRNWQSADEERKLVGSRWVFAKKYDEHGKVNQYKARQWFVSTP